MLLVLNSFAGPIPKKVYDVDGAEDDLDEGEGDSLGGDALEDVAPAVHFHCLVDSRNKEIK